MAGTLTFLLISSLLQGALCETFNINMPQNINVVSGSCVIIPCFFDVERNHKNNLDDSCKAYWSNSTSFNSKNAKLKPTKEMTGDLTKKDCTTTFNNASLLQRSKYYFRLECNNSLKYIFTQAGVDISFIDDPPSPTLTPSTLEVEEGASVSLTCSAPAPCWSHPPALTWSPNLGQSQETLQENQDKTKVRTSVMNFTASHLHHGNKISCTAVYQKQDGSPDVTAETSLTPDISNSPKNITVSVSPSGPVPENSKVSLTCSSNANPAVWNYTWYRADGDQETFIGTGTSLNIQVSRDRRTFFCKAENKIGVGRSSSIQIDVQYSPENITVSVSPSGPVPENSNVSLTCSTNANPAVRNYMWYRVDGDQETFIGTGTSLNIKVSRDRRSFFCKAENEIGVGRSSSIQIDVQFLPQILFSSDCVKTASQVNCSCDTDGNPSPAVQWYLNGEPVNQSGGFEIFSETLNITVHRSSFILSQPHVKHFSTLLCRSFNSLGSASQQFCMSKFKSSAEPQGSVLYPAIVSTLVLLLLVLMCVLLFVIRTQTNHCKPKVGLIDENNTVAMIQPPTEEGNEAPNTTEESIYANVERLREAGVVDPKVVAEPSSTNLPSAEPVGARGSKNSENKGDKCEAIYSSVNWKTKSKKKKEETSVDLNSPGSYYLEEEKCIVEGINRNFVSNALEMGGLYDEVGGKNVKKEVDCEYAQVKFKDKTEKKKK
ncbi:sialic acid-binding Ig-like lectin 10 [Astatotilapia calliptera]|nr:sialic acid-binding Ig-like lectin 10 [Astatotilapia calliptera]